MHSKQDKINQLLENNKRYYPTDGKGNVDEWGAVIKKQVENFELHKQMQERERVLQKQNYGYLFKNLCARLILDKELMNQEEKKRMKEVEKMADRDMALREA